MANVFEIPADAKWTTEPVSVKKEGGRLLVEAKEGSDFWESTFYGFRHRNGHALVSPWAGDQAVEVSFELKSFNELYDQAGLMLWHGTERWIKAGIEVNDGILHAAVVVTDGYSDWSLAPVPEWKDETVTIRASFHNEAVVIRACTGSHPWRTLRVARFAHGEGKQAGPFLSAPKSTSLKVAFTRWALTEPDEDLHTDPPHPKA